MTWSCAPWRSIPIFPWVRLYVGRWLRAPASVRTALSRSGRRGPRKGVWSVRCWPISSCTTRSTYGCNGSIRASGSSVMPTMPSSTAGVRRKHDRCWTPSGVALPNADWSFILRRPEVVYCKDDDRRGKHEHVKFDFLGYTFQPRRAKNRWGRYFISFLPAISTKAAKAIRQTIRAWRMASTRNNQRLVLLSHDFQRFARLWDLLFC